MTDRYDEPAPSGADSADEADWAAGDQPGDHDHGADRPRPDAGAVAADALRLIGTAQEWAQGLVRDADGHQHDRSGPECQWCPLCQFVAVLRGERPELTDRVAEAGTALVTMLRAALDAAGAMSPPGQHRADGAPGADRSGPSGPAPRVQRIDLGVDASVDASVDPGADPEAEAI